MLRQIDLHGQSGRIDVDEVFFSKKTNRSNFFMTSTLAYTFIESMSPYFRVEAHALFNKNQ